MKPEQVTEMASGMVGMLIFIVVALLVVATILMPIYVMLMHSELKRVRKLLARMDWHLERAHARAEAKERGQ